uniref:HTH CENPB-type domain-containing protein n=1 Tax=Catharus ustulatus TaxID=91951 RepID=A0A8C3TNX7_CATUS
VGSARLAYDADFKLKAINHAKQHGNREAAREFNINESMVRKWRQQEDNLRLAKKTKVFAGIRQDAAGRSFSTVAVRIEAKAIANEMGIEDFKAGPSWCFRFMKRRQLSIRTRTTVCQRLPADYEEKVAMSRSYCKSKTAENNIERWGVDACGLFCHSGGLFRRPESGGERFLLRGGICPALRLW